MKFFILLVLMGELFLLSGCTSSILGTLLAPESVVGDAATDLAATGAETLSSASLSELTNSSSTVAELDRILMENPNAVNSERLQSLRDQLNATDKSNQTAGMSNKKGYRNNEKPLPHGKGDYISIKKAEDKSKKARKNTYPSTIPMGYSLYEEYQPVHFINLNAIRLQ
jgi:hypothetical protein